MLNQEIYTAKTSEKTYIELRSQGKVLQFELKSDKHVIGRDRSLADLVAPEDWQIVGRIQAVLCKEGSNYRIYDGDGKKPSTNGLYINHSRITPDTGYLLRTGVDIKIGQNPQI